MLEKDSAFNVPEGVDVESFKMAMKTPKSTALKNISAETAQNIYDTEVVRDVLPETRIIEEILTSTIISPNDTTDDQITVESNDRFRLLEETPRLLRVVTQHIEESCDLETLVPDIIADCLMRKGSHIIAVLPETLIDQQINSGLVVGNEALREIFSERGELPALGFLANHRSVDSFDSLLAGLESYQSDTTEPYDSKSDLGYEIVDNFDYLKVDRMEAKLRADRTMRIIAKQATGTVMMGGLEDHTEDPDKEHQNKLVQSFFDSRRYKTATVQKLAVDEKTPKSTDGFGYPVTITLPPESVIPVSVPGDPTKHVLYIVLLDGTSTPVRGFNSPETVTKIINEYGLEQNELLKRLRESSGLNKKKENERAVEDNVRAIEESYRKLVNDDVMSRLKSGAYGKEIEIGVNEDFYRNMLFQTLRKKKTRMLVLPAELVSYFAFEYNEYGVGKSLMEENRMLSIMRSITVFANTMAAASNSIAEKTISIKLDPDTPDPEKFLEEVLTGAVARRRMEFPYSNRPERIVDALNRSATNVVVEGTEHYPNTMVSITRQARPSVPVNTEWDEKLRNRFIQGFGLSPEQVDISTSVDYSSQVVTANVLATKRAIRRQKILEPQLTSHLRRFIWMSPTIQDHLREILDSVKTVPKELIRDEYDDDIKKPTKRYIKDFLLGEFIRSLNVKFPRPETESLQQEREAFNGYMSFVDDVIKNGYAGREMFDRGLVGDDFGERWETFAYNMKASLARKYLRERNLSPEIEEFLIANKTDKIDTLASEEIVRYLSQILESWKIVDKGAKKHRTASEKKGEQTTTPVVGTEPANTDQVSMDTFSDEGGDTTGADDATDTAGTDDTETTATDVDDTESTDTDTGDEETPPET